MLDMPLPKAITFDIEVRNTADLYAQLFVSDTINVFTESHSVGWQLREGRHSYTITLTQFNESLMRLIQFRLDPVADGANGEIVIYGISIESK
jgi:hypothetical protein